MILLSVHGVMGQTLLHGKIVSVDGTPIPNTQISTVLPGVQNIFTERSIREVAADDGSYELILDRPGVYMLTVRGVFHHKMNIPVLVYDQGEIEMDVLLFPKYYNDGRFFGNRDYLEWIRVTGNFNNYDFQTGAQFTLNRDGSISAMVPVTSDTMRIQVRGLSYGHGVDAIPPADHYELLPDRSFVSVLYNDLPEDSLEIRYKPGESIPYKRVLPDTNRPNSPNIFGFLTLNNELDRYWIEPLTTMQTHLKQFKVVDRSFSEGIPQLDQVAFQSRAPVSFFDTDWDTSLHAVSDALKTPGLHEQQVNLLLLAYAGTVHRAFTNRRYLSEFRETGNLPDIKYDSAIIERIPDEIMPGHIIWARNGLLPVFLLEHFKYDERWTNYFTDLVRYHSNSDLATRVAHSIVQGIAKNYPSAEQMPVYEAILERFGEGVVLSRAEAIYEGVKSKKQS